MFVVWFLLEAWWIILIQAGHVARKHLLDIVQVQERVNWLTRMFRLVLSQTFPSLLLFSQSFLLSVLVREGFMSWFLIKTKIKIIIVLSVIVRRREIVLWFLWWR